MQSWQGKIYTYAVEVLGIKEKKLPELNDEFAKDVSDAQTLEELRAKMRDRSGSRARPAPNAADARSAAGARSSTAHDFPVPEALVESQMDVRLERAVRSLAAQGVDPARGECGLGGHAQPPTRPRRRRCEGGVAAGSHRHGGKYRSRDEEVDSEIAKIAERSGESATAVRASLTKQGALDRMKSKLRSEKTLDWLCSNSRTGQ